MYTAYFILFIVFFFQLIFKLNGYQKVRPDLGMTHLMMFAVVMIYRLKLQKQTINWTTKGSFSPTFPIYYTVLFANYHLFMTVAILSS